MYKGKRRNHDIDFGAEMVCQNIGDLYKCRLCNKRHYYNSKIGIKHFKLKE